MKSEADSSPDKKFEGKRLLAGSGISSHDRGSIDDTSGTYTLEEGITAVGGGLFQSLLMIYVGFAWMSDAMEMMLLSFLGPGAKCEWDLTPFYKGLITSVVFVGMMFGAYTWGAIADAKGRRFGFFGTAVFTAICGFGSALAPNYPMLLLFRGLVGFGLGGVPVAFGLFLEFVPSSHRGQHSVILQSAWTVGSLVEAGLAWALMPAGGWRLLLAVSTIPLVLLLLFFPLLPESPHYLVMKGEFEKAELVLAKMARINNTRLPPGRLAATIPSNTSRAQGPQVGKVISSKARSMFSGLTTGLKTLYSRPLLRTTLLLHFAWFTNALTYYGLVMLTTELHAEKKEECGDDGKPMIDNKDYFDIVIVTMAEIIGLLLAFVGVDRLGRLKSMASYLGVCGASMLPLVLINLSVHNSTWCLFAARAGIVGSFTVIYLYTPEVYPTAVRSFGFGFATSFSRLGGLLSPLVSVTLLDAGHQNLAESIFIVMCASAAISVLLLPIETAGRELQDDEIEMTGLPAEKTLGGNHSAEPTDVIPL